MRGYVARKIGQALFVVFAAYTVTFVVLFAIPGDAVDVLISGGDGGGDTSQVDELRAELGLDQGLLVQYFANLGRMLTGDLGTSLVSGQPVAEAIANALPETLKLAALAIVLAVVVGTVLGVVFGQTRNPRLRGFLESLPVLGVSFPSFWIGLVLLQVFSFQLGLFPTVGNTGFESLVLPAVVLAIPIAASIIQVLSRNVRAVLESPYIAVARSQGIPWTTIVVGYGLRNALIPVITVIGLSVGGLLGGAVVTETIFSRQGIGSLMQTAVSNQDIPVVQVLVVLASMIFVIANLLADLSYPLLDPRVRATR